MTVRRAAAVGGRRMATIAVMMKIYRRRARCGLVSVVALCTSLWLFVTCSLLRQAASPSPLQSPLIPPHDVRVAHPTQLHALRRAGEVASPVVSGSGDRPGESRGFVVPPARPRAAHGRHPRQNHGHRPSPLLWTSRESHQVEKRDKTGRVLHHRISHLSSADLQGLAAGTKQNAAAAATTTTMMTAEQAAVGRERLLELLRDAGVHDADVDVVAQLPTWQQVAALYYTDAHGVDVTDAGPVLVGLDTCQQFTATVSASEASVAIAGLFNTGTNPAAMYLAANCVMPHNSNDKGRGMRWQVPWGKHMAANRKWNNTAGHDEKVNKTSVLPVVLVRDPYSWMQSMCTHPYAAQWEHADDHCPNLLRGDGSSSVPVTIKYPGETAKWDSLVHLWSDWYGQYLAADYPRLMVRFEDFIFRPKDVVNEICTCAGAVAKQETFSYVVDAGKWGSSVHAGSSNMVTAMIKYGSDKNRLRSLTDGDLQFAAENLDSDLLRLFQYQIPSTATSLFTS